MAPSKQYRTFNTIIRGDKEERELKLEKFKVHCEWYIGQHEIGAQGMEHIQLCFGFRKNKKTLAAMQKVLPDGGSVQVTELPANMVKYCSDETKRLEGTQLLVYGEIPKFLDGNVQTNKTQEVILHAALDTGNYYDAMKYIEEHDIVSFVRNRKSYAAYFEYKFAPADKSLYKLSDFKVEATPFNGKHKLFIGPTGIGKTQFALAHFNHPLLVRTRQDYARYNPEKTDGIVIDDMAFRNWQPESLINTLEWDMDRTERVLYGHCRIKAGTPQIICVNHRQLFYPEQCIYESQEAIRRRIVEHEFTEKLY